MIRVKINTANRRSTRCLAIWSNLNSYHFMVLVGSLPRTISKIRKIRVKETRIELPPTWRFYPCAISKIRMIRVKINTANRRSTHCLAILNHLSSYHFGVLQYRISNASFPMPNFQFLPAVSPLKVIAIRDLLAG